MNQTAKVKKDAGSSAQRAGVQVADHINEGDQIIAVTPDGTPTRFSLIRMAAAYYAKGFDCAESYVSSDDFRPGVDDAENLLSTVSLPFEYWLNCEQYRDRVNELLGILLAEDTADPVAKAMADLQRICGTRKRGPIPSEAQVNHALVSLRVQLYKEVSILEAVDDDCAVISVLPDEVAGTVDIKVRGMVGDAYTHVGCLATYCQFMDVHYAGVKREDMFARRYGAAFLDCCEYASREVREEAKARTFDLLAGYFIPQPAPAA